MSFDRKDYAVALRLFLKPQSDLSANLPKLYEAVMALASGIEEST